MERIEERYGSTSNDCCSIYRNLLVELRVLQYVPFYIFVQLLTMAEVLIRQNGIMPETGQAV